MFDLKSFWADEAETRLEQERRELPPHLAARPADLPREWKNDQRSATAILGR